MSTDHRCKPGPGKFEGESALAVMAYESANLGCADDDFNGLSWFKAPLNFDADTECVDAAKREGFCDACIADAIDHARELAGYLLHEDGNGFAYGTEFESADDYEAHYAAQLDDYTAHVSPFTRGAATRPRH